MNRTERKIAAELLHSQGVQVVHAGHEIYRAAHIYRDGLTDKEYKWLMQRHKNFEVERTKLSQLTDRLRKTS